MTTFRNLLLAALATAATTALATAQATNYSKTVGNSDAKATIEFVSSAIQGNDPFLANRYMARGYFEATGKVLNNSIDFIDVGARADSHDGGYVMTGSGVGYVPGGNHENVWFYINGDQIHATGAAHHNENITIPVANFSRNVTVGPFTVKVKAGPGITVGVNLDAWCSNEDAVIGAGPEAGITVNATGKLTAGPLGSITVTSEVGLAETEADITSESRPSGTANSLVLSGDALRIKIKLKCTVLASLIVHTSTLVNKSYGSWSETFNL